MAAPSVLEFPRETVENCPLPHMATVKTACRVSGLSEGFIRSCVADGRVKSVRAGHRLIVNLDSLAEYLRKGDAPPAATSNDIHRLTPERW